jgi:hypothetical protein
MTEFSKMVEHYSNDAAKWLVKNCKIADALSKWLSEPQKWLSRVGLVGSVGAALARLDHGLDMGVSKRGVRAGIGQARALVWSMAGWLVWVMYQRGPSP